MFHLKSLHHFTFLLVGTVLLAGAVDPNPVAAQQDPCVDCLTIYCNPVDPEDLSECHYASNAPHNAYYHRRGGVHPNEAYGGPCRDKHPGGCRGGGIDGILYDAGVLNTVLAAVSAGDALEVYRIIRGQPEESPFYFATERTAIQVRGCAEGTVAVHIPLRYLATPEFLAAVAAGAGSHLAP